MALGIVRISRECMVDALHLPPETLVVGAAYDKSACCIELIVRHDEIRGQGIGVPVLTPTFRNRDPVEFLGWGQDG